MTIISFEGIDGCGKTTQIKLLEKYLKSKNVPTVSFREPGGCKLSENIRDILLSPATSISGLTEFLLFSAARSQLVIEKIIPALEQKKWVLLDRYFHSSIVYQGYARGDIDPKILEDFSKHVIQSYYPNLVFYIKIDIKTSLKRKKNRSLNDRIERENNIFFSRAIEGYNQLCQKYSHLIQVINGEQPIPYIHSSIIKSMLERLPILS